MKLQTTKKNLHFSFKELVYDAKVEVFVNMDFEDADEKIKKLYPEYNPLPINPNFSACTLTVYNDKKQELGYAIIMQEFDWTVRDMATLSHEIFHLCNRILGGRGVLEDVGNDEAYAYYISYWTDRIFEALRPKKKTKKS